MSIQITFTDTTKTVHKDYHPVPARKALPEWFANLPAFTNNDRSIGAKGSGMETAKRCAPLLDSLSAGYIIPTPVDLKITLVDGKYFYQWPNTPGVEFQALHQLEGHSGVTSNYGGIPKIMLPWAVKTPPGYSCLYLPPLNQDQRLVQVFAGVIDTDAYHHPGAIPFLIEKDFLGIIPAGTPLVQVIPFKRDSFKMHIGGDSEIEDSRMTFNRLRSVFRDGYRKMFWQKKSYL